MAKCRQEGVSIARLFYVHGLKCASYPAPVICIVGVFIITCSLPFFITTSGDVNSPKPWRSPWLNYRLSPHHRNNEPAGEWIVNNSSLMSVRTPLWFIGLPSVIIQQIYTDVEVDCTQHSELCQRSYYSLSKTSSALVLDSIETSKRSCMPVLHPAAVKFARLHSNNDILPVFSSSILSPLLDNVHIDNRRSDSLKAVQANLSLYTIKELFYGGFWERSLTQSSKNKPKSTQEFQLALTLALQPTDDNFNQIIECIDTLNKIWPLKTNDHTFVKHFYYESEWTISNFAPLICLYSIVFLYISFSVGKIDLVRSKLGLGFTAVITVLFSLTMSLGICTFLGLSITVSGSEIFPFVVVVIGLENILIITKAVISTDPGLDVKFRIAEGLSKEGKALTKNLVTVLCLVVLGIFTFNYAMKEFCIISLVGLLCDFFLHIVFFTTVLSIDIRRMELSDLKLSTYVNQSTSPQLTEKGWRIPKRDRVNNFIVRNRFAQKFMMLVLAVYLMSVVSHTQTFHSLVASFTTSSSSSSSSSKSTSSSLPPSPLSDTADDPIPNPTENENTDRYPSHIPDQNQNENQLKGYVQNFLESEIKEQPVVYRSDEDGFGISCGEDSYCWRPMVTRHWPHLLQFYNVTLEKRFITVLPPIMVNYRLGFSAQQLFAKISMNKNLIQAISDALFTHISIPNVFRGIFLVFISSTVLIYLTYLYREVGGMKHQEEQQERLSQQITTVHTLRGHVQDIECLSVDEGHIITAGLDGLVYVWGVAERQCSTIIDRSTVSPPNRQSRQCVGKLIETVEHRLRNYPDTTTRHVEGCEADVTSPTPSTSSSPLNSIKSTQNNGQSNNGISYTQAPHPPSPPVTSLTTSLTSSSQSSSIIPIPQRYIPGFLKRLSMPTILKKSPDKRSSDVPSLSNFQSVETIPEHSSLPHSSVEVPVIPPSPISSPNNAYTSPGSSRSGSLGSSNSTRAVTMYTKPLVSHSEGQTKYKRKSVDSISNPSIRVHGPHETMSMGSHWSAESLSMLSDSVSELSYETPDTGPPSSPAITKCSGFQFKQHFSVFSQFTSDLALAHCSTKQDELWDIYAPPPIWCMDSLNGTVAVGCGNGQIEAWSIANGSLKFCLCHEISGVTVVRVHPVGIISGHLDGYLHLIGHHGRMVHSVHAHSKPISMLSYSGDYVVTGGYDRVVKVYRISDFIYLRALLLHNGHITSLNLIESEYCLSGCSAGIVCLWDYKSGLVLQEIDCKREENKTEQKDRYEEDSTRGIVKVCCNKEHIIALLRDSSVHVWDKETGHLSNIIEMGGYSHDIALLGPRHLAIALQSQILIYDIISRHEINRKELENTFGIPIVRHLTPLEPSTLVCTSGREIQLVPTGLKTKSD